MQLARKIFHPFAFFTSHSIAHFRSIVQSLTLQNVNISAPRFQLEYQIGGGGSEGDSSGLALPVMIHRAELGSVERIVTILTEKLWREMVMKTDSGDKGRNFIKNILFNTILPFNKSIHLI